MNAQTPITVTLTLEELMRVPAEGVILILDKAAADDRLLLDALEWETRPNHGKGRWVVMNWIRRQLTKPTAHNGAQRHGGTA